MKRARLGLVLCLLAFAMGCERVPKLEARIETSSQTPLRFAVLPQAGTDRLRAIHDPLVAEVSRRAGRPGALSIGPGSPDLELLLAAGQVDVAWLPDAVLGGALARKQCVPLARVVRRGLTTYRGVIVARSDTGVRALPDLKGRTFAYVDRYSSAGFLRTNQLFVEAGLVPTRDFKEIYFSGGHRESLEGVRSGTYDGAALTEGVLDESERGLTVLARTPAIANDVVVASPLLPEATRQAIATAFLEMSKDDAGRKVLGALHALEPLDGFAAVP